VTQTTICKNVTYIGVPLIATDVLVASVFGAHICH
jgi:hypothetical protein